jgi:hypothetical protein
VQQKVSEYSVKRLTCRNGCGKEEIWCIRSSSGLDWMGDVLCAYSGTKQQGGTVHSLVLGC